MIANVFKKIIELIRFDNKLYWYNVKWVYKVNGQMVFNFQEQIGLRSKSDILNHRRLKKILQPLHKYESMRKMLFNGVLICEDFSYLGRFSKKQSNDTKQ